MAWGDYQSIEERRKEALERELNRKVRLENTINILESKLDKEDDKWKIQCIKDDLDLAKNYLYECNHFINRYS